MNRIVIVSALVLTLTACGSRDRRRVDDNRRTDNREMAVNNRADRGRNHVNVVDSLDYKRDLGKVIRTNWVGVLPAASNPGIRYDLTVWAQERSGDGVYQLVQTYIEGENGRDVVYTTYGRKYTVRGDAADRNATVFQLRPFKRGEETVNFLYRGDSLTLLGQNMALPTSRMNYSLKEKSRTEERIGEARRDDRR